MKNFILFLSFSLAITLSPAQQLRRCETMEADTLLRATHSTESLEDFELWVQAKIAAYKNSPAYLQGNRNVVTIPIIFHVIHNGDNLGSGENISQAQINSQIAALNEDFRKASGTLGYNTHPAGADCEIEFCAAVVDPSGVVLAEPGIDRKNMGQVDWQRSTGAANDIEAVLKPATIWDPERYCNVWTVRFGGASSSLLGYAQFPSSSGLQGLNNNGGSANTDGVVVRFNATGRVGTLDANYNKGRTLTHELGHWLGLRHIWGDQSCGNDYCNDTPTSTDANYGCPNQNTCNDGGTNPPDMVQNYMDYSDDECMNIFTNDQKTRMVTVLNNSPRRNNLITSSTVCTIPFTFSYTGKVVDAQTNQGIPNAKVLLDGPADYTPTTDANGFFTISNLQQDNYSIYAGKWGYITNTLSSQAFNPNTPQIVIALQKGYYDDFLFDYSWTNVTTSTSGTWVRGVPSGTTYTANNVTNQSNPGADVNGDYGNLGFVTGNGGGAAGDDDVDGGSTTLTSPVMDLTTYTNPVARYYRWFFNSGGSGTPNDSLIISLVNGTTVIDIDKVATGQSSNQWIYKSYRIKDYITNPGNNVYFRCRTFDNTPGHLVEAGLDFFRVIDSTATSGQPPVANFASSATQVCAGTQVTFNDLSSNSPTQWTWSFPGGSPNSSNVSNPVISYSTPGTYAVTLVAANAAGSNSSTQTSYITVEPVVAAFSQDVPGICPGFSVTFANETSCSPNSIQWIFNGGDPATSTDNAPVVTYSSPGFYDVILIAQNSFGNDTLTQNLAVQVFSSASINTTTVADTNGTNTGTATAVVTGGVSPYTYLWNDPAQQTTQTATGLSAGVYNVTVTDANGCKSISSATVMFENISGIAQDAALGVSVYPNPTKGVFNVKLPAQSKADIYNALGEIIWKFENTNATTHTLNMSGYASGVYAMKVSVAEKQLVIKLVKE
ncbi:MAG: PKD domain-containing protein [Bacteroidetes bacterium]|nr:PKD domain-containing protein [Bacteroidota bacterium]